MFAYSFRDDERPAAAWRILDRRAGVRGPAADGAWRANPARCTKFLSPHVAALLALLLVGCATHAPADPVVQRLQARFAQAWDVSTYAVATVDTPQGLWNVYVISIPPDQVAIRQSRQDGEYEFGMINDLIWHIAFGRAQPTVLGKEWTWFMRNHQIFRFSEWLATLHFQAKTEIGDASPGECDRRAARDGFDLPVVLCIDPAGDPLWIERTTPVPFGGGVVRIEIDRWDEYQGRRMLAEFRQFQGDRIHFWTIQGVLEVEPEQRLNPPAGLSGGDQSFPKPGVNDFEPKPNGE